MNFAIRSGSVSPAALRTPSMRGRRLRFFPACRSLVDTGRFLVHGRAVVAGALLLHAAASGAAAQDSPIPGVPLAGGESCTCDARPSVEDAYEQASLIFVGQVKDRATNPLKKNDREIKFKVTRKLKGFDEVPGSGEIVIVYTPDTREKCGVDFGPGLDYLVFANGNPAYYHTTSCSRTDVLDKVLVDVHKLLRLTNNIESK